MLPDQPQLRDLTQLAESIGHFADPTRIGFRNQWLEQVTAKGYEVVGHELVPKGNSSLDNATPPS